MEVKIKQGNEMLDATIEMVDGVMVVSPKEVKFEPKDGDVVTDGDGSLFIYKESLNGSNVYVIVKDNLVVFKPVYTYNVYRFATEEEKKKLFDKLAEEGWEWKPATKELVKLRWKPKINELYYLPRFDLYAIRFLIDYTKWSDNDEDEDVYDNGWVFRTKKECQEFCNRLNDAINSVKP